MKLTKRTAYKEPKALDIVEDTVDKQKYLVCQVGDKIRLVNIDTGEYFAEFYYTTFLNDICSNNYAFVGSIKEIIYE